MALKTMLIKVNDIIVKDKIYHKECYSNQGTWRSIVEIKKTWSKNNNCNIYCFYIGVSAHEILETRRLKKCLEYEIIAIKREINYFG